MEARAAERSRAIVQASIIIDCVGRVLCERSKSPRPANEAEQSTSVVVCLARSMFPKAGSDYGISEEPWDMADGRVVLGVGLFEIAG